MVRPGYRLSETVPPLPIFSPDPGASLTGFHEFRSNWAIDWARFADMPVSSVYYRIKLGQIPVVRIGKSIRIDPDEALAALKQGGAA